MGNRRNGESETRRHAEHKRIGESVNRRTGEWGRQFRISTFEMGIDMNEERKGDREPEKRGIGDK
jgi:hypothetical protein